MYIRKHLPDNNFTTMLAVLQKFFNFMTLTSAVSYSLFHCMHWIYSKGHLGLTMKSIKIQYPESFISQIVFVVFLGSRFFCDRCHFLKFEQYCRNTEPAVIFDGNTYFHNVFLSLECDLPTPS